MPILLRFLPLVGLVAGISATVIGMQLEHSDLTWIVQFVGQAGSSNPKILEKVRLVPSIVMLTGVEMCCSGLLLLAYTRRIPSYFTHPETHLERKQKLALLIFSGYGLTALLSLNFGIVTLAHRQGIAHGLSNEERVAVDFGEDYAVVKVLKDETPTTACILIRTQAPIKYLLNYHLFPRRFFVYPDPDKSVSEVSPEWLQRYGISWTLEIKDDDPRQFVLLPVRDAPIRE